MTGMTRFQIIIVALLSALVLAVVIGVIAIQATARQALVDQRIAQCKNDYPGSGAAYFLCVDQADD